MTQYALYNPATHVAVPKEPTPEMLVAMHEAWEHGHFDGFSQNIRRAAAAMLNAAPPHGVEIEHLRRQINYLVCQVISTDELELINEEEIIEKILKLLGVK